jgi:hypothetical protein
MEYLGLGLGLGLSSKRSVTHHIVPRLRCGTGTCPFPPADRTSILGKFSYDKSQR